MALKVSLKHYPNFLRKTCNDFADAQLRPGKSAEAEPLLRQAVAVFQELKLDHEIKKAEELLQRAQKGGEES